MDLQVISAIIFVVVLCFLLILERRKLYLQKIFFPFIYLLLYKTKAGLKLMDRVAEKYREHVKLFGYISVGLGYIGMFLISYAIVVLIVKLIFQPATTASSMVLVLPFTNIPGIGFLPFTHWLISIFILAIVHEFAHGVVARAHNVEVKASGFAVLGIVIPLIPAAFVEPNEKKLKKESDIVQYSIFSAGPIANIVFALIILFFVTIIFVPVEAKITKPAGFSFDLTNSSLPAAQSGLKDGIIITNFNGKKIENYELFINQMQHCIKTGENISLATDNETFVVTTISNPDFPEKPFIGVKNIKNEVNIKDEYTWFSGIFFWLKDLFKWLFMLNFFIGLANLLPLGIVDGGRMLQVTLNKLVKNKKKAHKIWSFIAMLFLLFLIFGLLTTYLGNPFALLK